MGNRDKAWQKLEDYIAMRLQEIDPYARHTKASGGSTEKKDIRTSCGLAVEAKQRATENVTIMIDVWQKLNSEIPLHVKDLPMLALENKNKKRFAVLDLNDFLDLFIELWKLKNEK